jgi:hypothetical protein
MSVEKNGRSPGMSSNATHGDADIILRLYDMRREATMRTARQFVNFEFWPKNFDEFAKLFAAGGKEFGYFRQVTSYWDMAVSFVVRGALDAHLLLDNANEMFFLYAKLKPFLPEFRENINPQFLKRIEDFIVGTPEGQDKLRQIEKNVERVRQQAHSKAAKA